MLQNNDIQKIKVVFMGTADLSETVLKKLIAEHYNLIGVFTKPDVKVGRKQTLVKSAVKILAEENNIPVFQPQKFKTDGMESLKILAPDLIVVAAYGKILPKEALEIPRFGCINVHISLLPKYRGASPVQNALLNGETETGTTIMLMDEGVDTGNILSQEKIKITESDTTETLMSKLADSGAELLIKTLPRWIEGGINPIKQDNSKATFCKILSREDGKIDWNKNAQEIYNQYRAMFPWPGIFTEWKNNDEIIRLKLISIKIQGCILHDAHSVGEIFKSENNICVQTSKGVIILKEVQKEGKKIMSAKDFLNGYPKFIGSIFR